MPEWKNRKLCELGEIVGGATPSTNREDYYNGDIAWLTPKDLAGYTRRYISKGERSITELGLKSCSAKIMPKHSVLFTSRAPIGYVAISENDICTNQGFKSIVPNDNTDYLFLYYLLKYNKRFIESLGSGTTFKEVSGTIMKNIEFKVPEYAEQKRISSILSSLDDLMEQNERINRNLETQAQAIFKSWFVDFEPFQDSEFVDSELGKIPKDWKVVILSGVCSLITRGITPKYTEKSDQIILNQKCIREHQVSLAPSRYHVPKKINEKWLQYGDILVNSTGQGTLGRTAQWYQEELNITVDSHVTIVRPQEPNMIYYIGQFIMGKEYEIESMASGSTGQTELSRERLGSLKVIIPHSKQLEDFSAIVEPFMKQITINNKETLQLATLRDTLLPKLMSGEIQIPQEV